MITLLTGVKAINYRGEDHAAANSGKNRHQRDCKTEEKEREQPERYYANTHSSGSRRFRKERNNGKPNERNHHRGQHYYQFEPWRLEEFCLCHLFSAFTSSIVFNFFEI
jgi:hypothetical protein